MKALLKIGFVAAFCLTGNVVFGQEPVKKAEALPAGQTGQKAPVASEPVKASAEKPAPSQPYQTLSLPAGSTIVPAENTENKQNTAAPTSRPKPVVSGTREKSPVQPAGKQAAPPVR